MEAQGRRERPRRRVLETRKFHVRRRALRPRGWTRGGGRRGGLVGWGHGGSRRSPGCVDRRVTLAAEGGA